ncbi:MAG: hypothetical protein ABEJ79_06520 [Halolamina sp.]
MYAASWTDRVRVLREELSVLHERRRLGDQDAAWKRAQRLTDVLWELGTLTAGIGPPPRLESQPTDAADLAVRQILDARYDDRAPTDAVAEAVDRACQDDRCDRPTGSLIVPLRRDGPTTANWYVVLPWTSERLRELAGECRRLRRRLDLVAGEHLPATFGDIAEAFATFAGVLDRLTAEMLWLYPPDGLVDADYDRVESFLKRVIQTTES